MSGQNWKCPARSLVVLAHPDDDRASRTQARQVAMQLDLQRGYLPALLQMIVRMLGR